MKGQGEYVILVRNDTSPEDISGMEASRGIITRTGGKTSHAAVVARGWGKPCITGCGELTINEAAGEMKLPDGRVVKQGDWVSFDGATGEIYSGQAKLLTGEMSPAARDILVRANTKLRGEVHATVGSPSEISHAVKNLAHGIGPFSTDHMFYARLGGTGTTAIMREALLADTQAERKQLLAPARRHKGAIEMSTLFQR